MKITKQILATACLAFTFATNTQAQEKKYNYRVTPLYAMTQLSGNYSDYENTHFQDWNKVLGWGAAISLGKEFSPLWGWRLSAGYSRNKQCSNWRESDRHYMFFNDVELFGDITFDFSDLVFNNNKRRRWKVMLFGGVGGAKSYNFGDQPLEENGNYTTKPKPVMGLRGGVNVSYMISNRVALALEGGSTMFQDRFNGVKDDKRVFDARTNIGVGLVFLLNKYKGISAEPVIPVEPILPLEPTKTVKVYSITPILTFLTPENEIKNRKTEVQRAYLYFPVNKTIIYPDFEDNANELKKIENSIDKVKDDDELIFKSMTMHGYASIEGKYKNNKRLAQGRAESLRTYIMEKYGFSDKVFTVKYTPEDWAGLKEYLEKTDLNNKQEIMDLINDKFTDPDYKEYKMKILNGGTSYKYLLKNVFPKLRHTDYYIDYEIRQFQPEEAKGMIFESPEKLNLFEMFSAANAFDKGSEEQLRALKIAADRYPDSQIANLNLASALLEKKNVEEAKKYLIKVNECPQKTHDLGVIEALEGNYDKARSLFQEAAQAGLAESSEMLRQLAD